jgi:hypothetical protein
MRLGTKHSEEYRARQSAKMKDVYNSIELRQRVSEQTARTWREGKRTGRNAQLNALEEAWSAASDPIRIEFLARRLVPGRRIDG